MNANLPPLYKPVTIIIILIILISIKTYSQPILWGVASQDSPSYHGFIYTINTMTGGQIIKHQFNGGNGSMPTNNVLQASDGVLYGMTSKGGFYNNGVIFKFDPHINSYTKLIDFDGINGAQPYGSLIQASNGLLYGMTTAGGINNSGVIFKFDPLSNTYTKTYDFDQTLNEGFPMGNLVQANNGILYGMSGGYGMIEGSIFKYDPSTDTYSKTYDFIGSQNEGFPMGSLIQADNGILYGMSGGMDFVYFSGGSIFKYNPVNDIYTKTYNFNFAQNEGFPAGDLFQASNGILYGMSYWWSIGSVFKYDPINDNYFKTVDFDGTNGGSPMGNFMQATNNKLYAYTYNNQNGNIIEYNTNTDNLTNLNVLSGPGNPYPYLGNFIEIKFQDEWSGVTNTNWNTSSNWLKSIVPAYNTNVTIPAAAPNQPVISGAANCNDLILESGASLTLLSNASNTATIITYGEITNNGTIHVERFFSGNDADWHLVSSPISDAKSSVFLDMHLQSFNENTYEYSYIVPTNIPLHVMEGYGLYSTLSQTNTVTFTGQLNSGDQSASFSLGADSYNWNLLGTPYPSSIDWETVAIPPAMSNEVHYIEATTGNNLSYVQGVGGTGSQYIGPHQGFFISANAPGSLSFNNYNRSHNGSGNFYKSSDKELLILQASGNNYSDQTIIHFNDNANIEHDGIYDAYKRISTSNPDLPQLFSITPNDQFLSINGTPKIESIPLGFTALNSGSYNIEIAEYLKIDHLILEDTKTRQLTNLFKDSYTFNHLAGENPERFVLHFTPYSIDHEKLFDIYSSGNQIFVFIPENQKGNILITNISGQTILESNSSNTYNNFNIVSPGIYIVSVKTDNDFMVEKVLVK